MERTFDEAVEQWLHREVADAADEFRADPSSAIPAEEVRARLASKWADQSQQRIDE